MKSHCLTPRPVGAFVERVGCERRSMRDREGGKGVTQLRIGEFLLI